MERGGGRFACTWGPARGPGGSGTAGAVGMKHGRAMLRGPSWCGEQERPLPVLPLVRESAALRALRVSLLPKLPCFAWDDDLSFLNSEIFWCELPKQGACFRLEFVHRTRDLSFSLSQHRQTYSFDGALPISDGRRTGIFEFLFSLDMREE